MKKILLGLLLAFNLCANVEVSQNMRALYKGIKLTELQEDYILDNQDYNIDQIEKALKKELKTIKSKYIDEKNVISFKLTQDGEIKHIKFLKKSDNRKINKITKQTINKTAKRFKRPKEDTIMRYIISFQKGRVTHVSSNSTTASNKKPYYQNISRGTTRFEHTSKEYVREFETSEDGFVNLSVSPQFCLDRVTLLTGKGQRIKMSGRYAMSINEEVPKGKYKILFKTHLTCNVNLEYQ